LLVRDAVIVVVRLDVVQVACPGSRDLDVMSSGANSETQEASLTATKQPRGPHSVMLVILIASSLLLLALRVVYPETIAHWGAWFDIAVVTLAILMSLLLGRDTGSRNV
jgi:hypothetical protein